MSRRDEKEKRYLPVDDPEWVSAFAQEYFDELAREARRACWKHNIRDFADDALSIAFEKFMSSRIEDRGPRSAIAFATTIIKNTVIDEVRRRGRHAILAGAMTGDLGDDEDGGMWVPEPQSNLDPERDVLADYELHAVSLGFKHLPELMSETHKNVGRDLEIVQRRYLLGMSWKEIAADMDISKAHRQSASRGRELLRGFVHALTQTQPAPDAVNRKYWERGYEVGEEFREESDNWPPTGRPADDA